MRQKVLYIGKNAKYIAHFVRLLDGDIEVFRSHIDVLKRKHLYNGIPLLFFFYERDQKETDLGNISVLHKAFPRGCIILVTESLTNNESLDFLKNGIQNTVTPYVEKAKVQGIFDFNVKHQNKIDTAFSGKKTSMKTFHLPIWKRCFDIFCSILALIILSPLLLLTALAIRLESRGPVIYKSKRVGSNYKVFNFLKFRSMYMDSDKRLKEFGSLNQYKEGEEKIEKMEISDETLPGTDDQIMMVSDDFILTEEDFIQLQRSKQKNAFVKFEKDPRITKVGHIIRNYSIDELPQLINILMGDMSVVGNRPLPLYEAELLTEDEYIDRFMAPSGLTGLWQVEKRGEAGKISAEERKLLDIRYSKEFSLFLDIKIIFKTFTAFIQKENV